MDSDPSGYDLQLPSLVKEIRKRGCKMVGIQLPDGLKRYLPQIRRKIEEETDAIPVFSTEPCYGACDVSESLSDLGCDLIFHLGHSKMVDDLRVPVIYIPCFSRLSAKDLVGRHAHKIPEKRVGLIASVQHVNEIPAVSQILSQRGFEVHVGVAGQRTQYDGQVLGCNFEAARRVADEVDAFLYIGGGNFHPLGVALATGKAVYVIDPYAGEMRDVGSLAKKTLHKRFAQIEHARETESFGLLVSAKPGQRRMKEAINYQKMLRRLGKDSAILTYDRLDPRRLVSYQFDAYVNFGCPRIPIEDSELFPKPILTPLELEILMGTRPWEDYSPDEIA